MTDNMEKREFSRTPIQIEVTLDILGEKLRCDRTRDLSMKGLLIETDKRVPLGTPCKAVIFLGECGSLQRIEVEAVVVRHEDSGMAIDFTLLLGAESYEHLRNLVLYNSGEKVEEIEKELQSHIGLKKKPG